jgi:hypothetical protein
MLSFIAFAVSLAAALDGGPVEVRCTSSVRADWEIVLNKAEGTVTYNTSLGWITKDATYKADAVHFMDVTINLADLSLRRPRTGIMGPQPDEVGTCTIVKP